MNEEHLRLCSSPEWAETLATKILPWALNGVQIGDDLLEVGPGPGLTTDVLRHKVPRLTAVEADPTLAAALATRLAGTNVAVLHADATDLPFDDGTFTAAASFTMLHHVPSAALQDRLLAEVARVLRPGGRWVFSETSIAATSAFPSTRLPSRTACGAPGSPTSTSSSRRPIASGSSRARRPRPPEGTRTPCCGPGARSRD
jgi:SAM-dependent methyltransferase